MMGVFVEAVIFGLGLAGAAAGREGPARPPTPSEQYRALLEEDRAASSIGRPLSDAERMAFIGRTYRRRNEIARKFVALAERYPNDPIAVEALIRAVWQVNTTPWPVEVVGRDEARARTFALLQRDHIRSRQLGPVCRRISSGFCAEYETFLREVLERSPHRDVRAEACLSLAQFLNNRSQRLALIGGQPPLIREFEDLFGKAYLAGLRERGPEGDRREAEALLERAAREYGDVRLTEGGTVVERAEAGLFEMRHLVVGARAPEIEGEDQDGRRFRLSDYRGKVVLLDFWSEY